MHKQGSDTSKAKLALFEKDLLEISPLAIGMTGNPHLFVGCSVVLEGSSHFGFRTKLLKESKVWFENHDEYGVLGPEIA